MNGAYTERARGEAAADPDGENNGPVDGGQTTRPLSGLGKVLLAYGERERVAELFRGSEDPCVHARYLHHHMQAAARLALRS
jgi:hypothetical protein